MALRVLLPAPPQPCTATLQGRQLSLLSKDFNRADIATTQFLINGCAPLYLSLSPPQLAAAALCAAQLGLS